VAHETINPAVSDDWIFYEPNPDRNTCEPQPCPVVAPPKDHGDQLEPAPRETPSRPCRQRLQLQKLVLDPKAEFYTQ